MSDNHQNKRRKANAGIPVAAEESNAGAESEAQSEVDVVIPPPPPKPFMEVLRDTFDNFDAAPFSSGAALMQLLDFDVEIFAFLEKVSREPGNMSSEDLGAWKTREREEWPSNGCDTIDAKFNSLAEKLTELHEDLVEKELCKTSGAQGAKWSIVWNYPVPDRDGTSPSWAMVMDPANPCMKMQERKIGMPRNILVTDTYPIRQKYVRNGVRWKTMFPNWKDMEEATQDYTFDITKDSPFVLLLGQENWAFWPRALRRHNVEFEKRKIELKVDGTQLKMYDNALEFYVVRDSLTKEVQQLIFIGYHPQFFLYGASRKGPGICEYHDLLWNALAEWSGVRVSEEKLFTVSKCRGFKHPKTQMLNRADNSAAKVEAFMATHQVQQLLIADEEGLSERMLETKNDLLGLQSMTQFKKMQWIGRRCQFYSKLFDKGLRWRGDKGPEVTEPYPYEGIDDPRVTFVPLMDPARRSVFRRERPPPGWVGTELVDIDDE
ncbi:hypothetical protein E8E14_013654 [Neopestalotiopsis sp. 37M]|nr:hypothetical protein E8E14_013654 [Neopestalotiopsis sp. 37M]